MPPKLPPSPEFSLTGRYVIDVSTRKENPVFHDIENAVEACGLDSVAAGNKSRFNNPRWALSRGFRQCSYCSGVS